jgi:hypothetical protein
MPRQLSERSQEILVMAADADGVTSPQVAERYSLEVCHAGTVICELTRRHVLTSRRAYGVSHVHYFADTTTADAWVARQEAVTTAGLAEAETKRRAEYGAHRTGICDLAARHEGVTAREAMERFGIPGGHISTHMADLVKQGRLHRCEIAGKRLRWFASEQARDAYVAALPAPAAPRPLPSALILQVIQVRADGMLNTEIARAIGSDTNRVGYYLSELRSKGLLFSAPQTGHKLRYFALAADRDAWLQRPTPKLADPKKERKERSKAWLLDMGGRDDMARNKPGPQIQLPGSSMSVAGKVIAPARAGLQGEPDYSRAVVTVCPGYADRRFAADGAQPLFSSRRPGEYDMPASDWARAVARA